MSKVRGMLINGKYGAGEKLNEEKVAKTLGVSRTPVRAAFVELAKEGLLDYEVNKGYSVRRFSSVYILSAMAVREVLEGMAARLAADVGLSDDQLSVCEACILQADGLLLRPSIGDREISIFIEINGRFHDTIVRASGNPALVDALAKLHSVPLVSPWSLAATVENQELMPEVMRASQEEHRAVFDALCNRDADKAGSLLTRHLEHVRSNLSGLFVNFADELSERDLASLDLARLPQYS